VWAAAGLLLVGVLGYRQIEVSARILSVFMVCEVVILMVLNVAIIARHGGAALPSASFSPGTITGAGIGVSMTFAFISFIGFESAALYGEESRNPRRSVARATYIAVALVASFYAFTSWVAVGAVGPGNVRAVATDHLGDMFFNLSDDYLSVAATDVMQVLLCTSLFAGWLALHNAANRYLFVLGRERVLPRWLDAVHRTGAPHRASLVQTLVSLVIAVVFAGAGLDPYTSLTTSMLGLGTVGIVVLQALASVSIVVFFARRSSRQWWRTRIAPALGLIGLAVATVLVYANFDVMTGTTNPIVIALPWLIPAAQVAGIGYALWMRSARPHRYARLARVETRDLVGEPAGAVAPLSPAPATLSPRA
jgi:amino acid transporter